MRLTTPFLAIALGVPCSLGCTSLDRFDTDGNAAYCGPMVGSPAFHEGVLPDGVPPALRMRMKLDIDALRERTSRAYGSGESGSRNETRPSQTVVVGNIATDDDNGLCASEGMALFDDSALRAIPELDHDPLSTLEFGDGRDYNFFAWADSTCQGTMLAVVSLMRNDDIEVRILKPATLPAADARAGSRPGFALFTLSRRDEGCGF
ncbi:MAG: hypothetical protein M3020_29035 [Myxococcota bacterium]|jgi:hypothetical protein|nr:hypothetical protein [Myxococcota bacterium]